VGRKENRGRPEGLEAWNTYCTSDAKRETAKRGRSRDEKKPAPEVFFVLDWRKTAEDLLADVA